MRIINWHAWQAQTGQPQPSWLLLVATYLVAMSSPAMLALLLFIPIATGPHLPDCTSPRFTIGYTAAFMVLMVAGSAWVIHKYRSALFAGYLLDSRGLWRVLWVGALMALPLALWKVWDNILVLTVAVDCLRTGVAGSASADDSILLMRVLHNSSWRWEGMGTNPLGVVLASLLVLAAPFWEEWLTSGYLANKLARFLPLMVVVLVKAGVFTMLHIPGLMGRGVDVNFDTIVACGVLTICARLVSGSWLAAVVVHLISNLSLLIPRCIIAAIYFWMESSA